MPERRTARDREKTHVWKSGRSVAETRTRWAFWAYMTYRDLVMAARSFVSSLKIAAKPLLLRATKLLLLCDGSLTSNLPNDRAMWPKTSRTLW